MRHTDKRPRTRLRLAVVFVLAGVSGLGWLWHPATVAACLQEIPQSPAAARLPEADLTPLARADELLASGRIDAALDLLIPLLEHSNNTAVRVDATRLQLVDAAENESVHAPAYERFLPISEVAQRRFALACRTHPEWLVAYRKRADQRAVRDFSEALARNDLTELQSRLQRYLLVTEAANYAEQLADRWLESGKPEAALAGYRRLLQRSEEVNQDEPPQVRVEDQPALNDLPNPAMFGALPEIVWGDQRTVEQRVSVLLRCAWAASELGDQYAVSEWLRQTHDEINAFRKAELANASNENPADRSRLEFGVTFSGVFYSADQVAEQLGFESLEQAASKAIEQSELRALSRSLESETPSADSVERWELVWRMPCVGLASSWPDRRSGNVSERAAGMRTRPTVVPAFDRDRMVVWDGNSVRVVDRWSGEPTIPLGAEMDNDPLRRGTVWQAAPLAAPENRRSAEGSPRYEVRCADGVWAFLGGDPRTVILDEAIRNASLWFALDSRREGSLLTGTPYEPPGNTVWEGTPIELNGRWYGMQRETAAQSERSRSLLVAWEPLAAPASGRIAPVWQAELGNAGSIGQRKFHEFSHPSLLADCQSLYVVGSLGMLAAVEPSEGKIRWWGTYPRVGAVEAGDFADDSHRWRSSGDARLIGDQLIAIPADSDQVFAVDREEGTLIWSVRLPDVERVVGSWGRWIVVAGNRLIWLDAATGKVAATYPATGEVAVGAMRPESEVLQGWPAGSPSSIGCCLNHQWLQIAGELRSERGRDEVWVWRPQVQQQFSLDDWNVRGGTVMWDGEGIWLVGESEIAHLHRSEAPVND